MRAPIRAWEQLMGIPILVKIAFHRKAVRRAAMTTVWVTASGLTTPSPMVLATSVETKAPRMFMEAARTTALKGESTRVETTVAMALAESFQPLLMSKRIARTTMIRMISCILQHDGLKNIGNVFAAVGGVFQIFVDFFPFDDEDGILHLVKHLSQSGPEDFVGVVFQAVDLDAQVLNKRVPLFSQVI